MTSFKPAKNKTPSEWEDTATGELKGENNQFLLAAAVGAGLLLSATVSPITGIATGALLFWKSIKGTKEFNRKEAAIQEYGCIAPFLTGDDFRDYVAQLGEEEVQKQIDWATEREYELTDSAEEFTRKLQPQKALPVSVSVGERIQQAVSAIRGTTAMLQPQESRGDDLINAMSERIRNTLIIGAQGSGKGLTVSNALDAVKAKNPDTTIFYVDPKNDEKETGYFDGRVDILRRIKGLEKSPSAVVEWFKAAVKEFQSVPGKKLLVLDEATFLSTLMKNEGEGNWFKSLIVGLVSVGDSAGWNIWIVCLNPNTDDIGISGGLRSQLMPLALITADSLATYTALIATQWLPKDKKLPSERIQELCNDSGINRCYYYGKFNAWNPLPKMQNFSGYDRDSRKYLEGSLSKSDDLIRDSITMDSEPKLSEIAQTILDIIKSGNPPTSFESVRKSRKWGDDKPTREDIRQGINELISSEFIEGDEEEGYKVV
ncbi:hypothetical protein H6G04_30020 [Calothrix membranacea FACHB-236]|nr:hypothetical protein [Calothrix membranacea FACHB-236]